MPCAPPPRGSLFQESLHPFPFWMLVACQLVNLTTWEQACPAFLFIAKLAWFIDGDYNSSVLRVSLADPEDLHEALRPLGMWRKRAEGLPRFAGQWLRQPPSTREDVLNMHGCGKYAADSWSIFVERRFDVSPQDGKLGWYLESLKGKIE